MGKLKIPKNLKHADYVDLIRIINERSLITSEKLALCKRSIARFESKVDNILKKLNDLELRYCDLTLSQFK